MLDCLLFSLALLVAYDAPPPYGYAVCRAALEVHADPFDESTPIVGSSPLALGALLMGEQKGRRYIASSVGRYGRTAGTPRAERGLFQLVPYWASRKRCNMPRAHLFRPFENIRCAAAVVAWMQDQTLKGRRSRAARDWPAQFGSLSKGELDALIDGSSGRSPDWRVHYRCEVAARDPMTGSCARSVGRVHRMQRRLDRVWSSRHTWRFWAGVATRAGPLLVRSLGTSWHRFR